MECVECFNVLGFDIDEMFMLIIVDGILVEI